MTSSWFFLSTLNYDARSATHQITMHGQPHIRFTNTFQKGNEHCRNFSCPSNRYTIVHLLDISKQGDLPSNRHRKCKLGEIQKVFLMLNIRRSTNSSASHLTLHRRESASITKFVWPYLIKNTACVKYKDQA